ncbi:hypothetical protein RU07_22395 [Agrobacterium tumefaciens]|uniref:Uncharacterized protein n=1 Tax=Agrobacterium tumefaciens TaxID=358 RepID=A0A0D0KMD2_AGRTU|nr:hypothetical protein RU07_22395 [Agrobacterium tumefaciens]
MDDTFKPEDCNWLAAAVVAAGGMVLSAEPCIIRIFVWVEDAVGGRGNSLAKVTRAPTLNLSRNKEKTSLLNRLVTDRLEAQFRNLRVRFRLIAGRHGIQIW